MQARGSNLPDSSVTPRGLLWLGFSMCAVVLLDVMDLTLWTVLIPVAALALAVSVPMARPGAVGRMDSKDLVAVAALFGLVVATFRIAFTVFTTDNVLGLFLAFALGLLIGVVGPVVYQVWLRRSDLRSLGIGRHNLREAVVIGLILAGIQFVVTLWGYDLPEPVDWVPLLVMSLVVGFFEAVFFRGFIQNRLEASFGTGPAVAGAAVLYGLYHVGYGMGAGEVAFLSALGLVYAIVFRLNGNILVLWPLLTPMGAFFNNLEAGDIELPWASIAGFADVAVVMVVVVWLAHRHVRKRGGRGSVEQAAFASHER